MDSTLDQALLQAVEAHRSGKLQDAERLYRTILEAQPKHPNTNHYLGVLAVGIGKPNEALPYLKTALEVDPKQGQFWISYVDALIEAKQIEEAKTALDEGKRCGLTVEFIAQILQKLLKFSYTEQPSQNEIEALLSHYNSGNWSAAEQLAKEMIDKFPNHQFGWKALGTVNTAIGRIEDSLEAMQRAVRLDPNDAEAHSNLGATLKDLGWLREAKERFREAIHLKPDYAEAHNNLGKTLRDLGRLNEAEKSYREAIRLKPDLAEAHNNLGNVLSDLGQLIEAEVSCREAIRLKPHFASAHHNLGNVRRDLGRLSEAEVSFREAICLKPDYAAAHNNIGNVIRELGRLSEAEKSCRKAIRLKPDYTAAHNNIGAVLSDLGRLNEAEASYREAIRLKPDLAIAHSNLGSVLRNLGELSNAEACYREAIHLKPDNAEAHTNLGNVLSDFGRFDEAEVSYREAIRLKPDFAVGHSNKLFSLNYVESSSPASALEEAKRYGSMVSLRAKPKFSSWHINSELGKLRVGFVSGDFRNHPVGYFIEGLLEHINHSQFELFAFPTIPTQDDLTSRIKPFFAKWIPLYGKSDFKAAEEIHQYGIDILIDLAGHTAQNRLPVFAYKPAPVQVSWLGYFATTGVPEMDFFLGDPFVSPESEWHHFSEKIWNLPETWLCLCPPSQSIPISSLPALKNGYVTFGCFGNLSKMNDQVIQHWATILQRVPNSKLLLKSRQLADDNVVCDVQSCFDRYGISSERLILEGFSSRTEYFEAYNRIDLVLDTFPYPGGTTSVDSLWMGIPVLTLKGDRFLSRFGESIAQNAGQTEWIANDPQDYVSKAVAFAANIQYLSDIRAHLRDKVIQTSLFDVKRFAGNFGDALWHMWKLKCQL